MQKDLDDWAKEKGFGKFAGALDRVDTAKVKLLNQALVKDGYVKSRKATAVANLYYWVSAKEIKPKVRPPRLTSEVD